MALNFGEAREQGDELSLPMGVGLVVDALELVAGGRDRDVEVGRCRFERVFADEPGGEARLGGRETEE